MGDFAALFQHGLIYGAWLSTFMSIIIFGSLYQNPEIWLHDAPAEIQSQVGPISARAKRQRRYWASIMMVGLVGLLGWSLVQLPTVSGAALTFGPVFLSTLVMLMTFNLFDLLIIDWLVVVTIRPRWIMLPGTEDSASYADYGFHWRAFLKGTAGIVLASALIAGIVALFGG